MCIISIVIIKGIHALSAILYNEYKEPIKTLYHMEQLLSFLEESLSDNTPDELLFGRAGYLSCLLLVKKHIPKEICDRMELERAMKQVFTKLVQSGKEQGIRDHVSRANKLVSHVYISSSFTVEPL